jgi:glucose-6-phosphate dehydrogenase assembly protein OpcA
MGRQLVYDSRQWVNVPAGVSNLAGLLEHPHAPELADLGWRRLTPMRQALAHGLRGAGELVSAPRLRARVLHRPGDEALAWLLIGWLSSRLGRPSERELAVTVSEQPAGVEATSVSIDAGEATAEITATMTAHQVAVTSTSDAPPSFFLAVLQESTAGGVAAELQTLGRDIGLIESIGAAHVRLRAGGWG